MKRFAIGDIHGTHKALLQCLERSNFNKEEDQLIVLGDVADGYPEVPECIEELITIPNLIPITGNHDIWTLNWLEYGDSPHIWLSQGGEVTFNAYIGNINLMVKHRDEYFKKMVPYYIDDNLNAYVHGGYVSINGLGNDLLEEYFWDRSLWYKAKSAESVGILNKTKMYKNVFIGHTGLIQGIPEKAVNVWNLDTSAGWGNKLTIMDVDTEEYWQSDLITTLYPNFKNGRK